MKKRRSTDAIQAVKILLADDHAMVRTGLRLLLQRLLPDCEVIEAENYPQALSLCREHPDLDLIMIDRVMPGLDQGRGLDSLCGHHRSIPVIVLSASEDPAHVRDAIQRGARGYLPKTTQDAILFSAIQLVLAGGQYLPHQLLDNEQDLDNAVHAAGSTSTLTPRQTDILECLSLGKTNKDIARQLHISPATVQTHINAIFRALAVTNRTQAVYVGGKLGLIRSQ